MPWYRTRWFVALASIVAGLIVLAAIITMVLYTLWTVSPEKRLIDAVVATVAQPASYVIEADDTRLTIQNDGVRQALEGTYDDIPLQAVVDRDTIYVRSSEPARLIEKFGMLEQVPSQMGSVVSLVAPVVKDKWVALNISNVSGGGGQSMNCGAALRDTYAGDSGALWQLVGAYSNNRFVGITTQTESAERITYTLRLHPTEVAEFADAVMRTDAYKPIAWQCDSTLAHAKTALGREVVMNVTIDKTTSRITELTSDAIGDVKSVKMAVQDASIDAVVVPENALPYDDIRNDVVRSLFKSFLGPR